MNNSLNFLRRTTSIRSYGVRLLTVTVLGTLFLRGLRLMPDDDSVIDAGTSLSTMLELPISNNVAAPPNGSPAAVSLAWSVASSLSSATAPTASLNITSNISTLPIAATTNPPGFVETIALYDDVTMARMRNMSSVDYFTCCGLGHRISKNADAYYIASRVLNFSLRVNWAHCDVGGGLKQEVSVYLFGPQPSSMVENVTSTGLAVKLHNEVFGFKKLIREGIPGECKCAMDKYTSDVEYYRKLEERFRLKDQVNDFVQSTFANYSVIGIHVRAGNNETGDFTKKNRGIENRYEWVQNMVQRLVNLTKSNDLVKPPLLYIATDTPSMVTMFTTALKGIMPVREFPQRRTEENKGVAFGGSTNFQQTGDDCLLNWENAMMDMMILSRADVIVAARPSSFSQSLPMILAYDKDEKNRVFRRPFCEIDRNATDIRCYGDFREWCCDGIGQFSLQGLSQRYEYLRVPTNVWTEKYRIRSRPMTVWRSVLLRDFLPYEYDHT